MDQLSDSSRCSDIVIVTISNNHGEFLARCLTSVLAQKTTARAEVHVVDNCSTDDTLQVLAGFHSTRVHRNAAPKGFAANNNAVIRATDSPYVLLLNPDTEMMGGAIDKLVGFLDAHPDVGMVGPRLVFPDGRIQLSARRFPSLKSVLARRTPMRKLMTESDWNRWHLMADSAHDAVMEVDWVLGGCLLIRRRALNQVGGLDEGYFLYVEDIDLAYRLHRAGWKVVYLPSAVVVHHHLAVSDRRLLSRESFIHMQSMFRYWRKHMAPQLLRLRSKS